jgi:hypothetical protein
MMNVLATPDELLSSSVDIVWIFLRALGLVMSE